VADGERCSVDPDRAAELFYADSDGPTAANAVGRLRPMVLDVLAFIGPPPPPPTVPTTYVVCTKDRALPVPAQRRLARLSDTVLEWPTDHSPFLIRPGEVAALLT
jgi:pimeloyl-ACP methyl ester carboxylesterase